MDLGTLRMAAPRPGILDRERIVAAPGFNRWLVPPSDATAAEIRNALETHDDRVSDLHLWQLGPGHIGAIVSIVTHDPHPPEHYKAMLKDIPHLSHTTVEVLQCRQSPAA